MANSREIETEAERQRAALTETLDALRQRMTTGELVDQAMTFARNSGGGEFLRNLGAQARSTPVPVALVATGLAWLMFAPQRTERVRVAPDFDPQAGRTDPFAREDDLGLARATREAADTAASFAGSTAAPTRSTADKARGAYASASTVANDTFGSARDSATSAFGAARDAASSAYDATADSASRASHSLNDAAGAAWRGADALRGRASQLGEDTYRRAQDVGGRLTDQAKWAQSALARLVDEQPLIVGALGVALGALIGAALPRSRTEDELMGDTADETKQAASEAVRSYYAEAREAATRVGDEFRSEAEEQGLTSGAAEDTLRGMGDKVTDFGRRVSAVAETAKESTKEEIAGATETRASGKENRPSTEEAPQGAS